MVAQKVRETARRFRAGGAVGVHHYVGDLSERALHPTELRPFYGVFLHYLLSKDFSVKSRFYVGNLSGSDAHARNPELRARSLQFKSHVVELSVQAEWRVNALQGQIFKGSLVPYLFVGGGRLVIHPHATYMGPPDEINDRLTVPLPETNLHLSAVTLLFGAGVELNWERSASIFLEGGWRYVFSDYLDGVSKNGNQSSNDWYYGLTAGIAF
ncbi:MAG: hypothetical protein JNJ57_10795 [Saprospiraceae bacterium]|nr:hypothetical protein [Saprospiraceae bacterium]